tara:strand:- start:87 stop:317 length:231 start_codon:yes stop_codon:yes gene_type:complete
MSSFSRSAAITASNSVEMAATDAVVVLDAGDVTVRLANSRSTNIALVGLVAGIVLPLNVIQVRTGGTATLVALYNS